MGYSFRQDLTAEGCIEALKMALNKAGGGFLFTHNEIKRLLIQLIPLIIIVCTGKRRPFIGSRDVLNIIRFFLHLEIFHDFLNILIGHKRTMNTGNTTARGHIKHITLAEKLHANTKRVVAEKTSIVLRSACCAWSVILSA